MTPNPSKEGAIIYFLYLSIRCAVIFGHLLGDGDFSEDTMNDWKLKSLCEQARLRHRYALDHIFYPFEWLSALLNVKGLAPGVTPDSIKRAATVLSTEGTQLTLADLMVG